jgi:calcium-dependent protein kinase
MGCCASAQEPLPISMETPKISSIRKKAVRKGTFVTNKLGAITERYEVVRALGSGTIGTLFHARELRTGAIRTIREINKQSHMSGISLFQEVDILRDLDHPNILKIFEAIETPRSYYIILENISGGTLTEKFKKIGLEGVLSKYIHEMFSGLNYLHKQGIAHCNLAPEYIVLSTDSDEAVIKIIGFTSAQKLQEKKEIDFNNLKYFSASPEIISGDFTEKTDIWSAGVILYTLLTDRQPFPRGSKNLLIEAIGKGNIDYNNSAFQSLSFDGQNLIKSLLKVNPAERPTCEKILEHPWFHESKQTLPITYNIAQKIIRFQVKSSLARYLLTLITQKLSSSKKDYSIINYFKSLDLNNDGKVSREEILNVFSQVGLNVLSEIDFIMENLDNDQSGFIDYTELILALTNWTQELKKKNLAKVFQVENGFIFIDKMKNQLTGVSPDEWAEFTRQASADRGKVSIENLKKYLKSQTIV